MRVNNFFAGKRWILSTILLSGALDLLAADDSVDFFQEMGKMYVVLAVIIAIFIGLAIYMYRIDRKLKLLEKRLPDEK